MTRRTKVQLIKNGIIALISLVVTIITGSLLFKAFPFWDIAMRLNYIEEQARISGWTDDKTADFEELLSQRNKLAQEDSFINWLLQARSSRAATVLRDFSLLGMWAISLLSIYRIYRCIRGSYRILSYEKKMIGMRDPSLEIRSKNSKV